MKIERLIGIVSLLMQNKKITATQLAEKFEVSYRTILRDIESINLAGIPIVTMQGKGGGISIMDGFKIDGTIFSSQEMQSILTGLKSLDSISNTNYYRQLMEKLSLSETNILNTKNHIIIDLSSWDKSAVSSKIELIKSAIENSEKIAFKYYSQNGDSERVIEPYHLIFQWSNWYVWGYCNLRNDFRMFKLTRLIDLKLTGEKCEMRDIPEYVCNKMPYSKDEVESIVKFDKSVKWRIIDDFGVEALKFNEEGNILININWSDIKSFYNYILTFGDKAEIISPEEYRQEFISIIKNISRNYFS